LTAAQHALRLAQGSIRGCEANAGDRLPPAKLLAGAQEPLLARLVLMHLLWAGEALVDLSGAIGENSLVCGRLQVVS
jgi:hypothetical protein